MNNLKLIFLGLVCLLLSGCVARQDGKAVSIETLHTKDNGLYQVTGLCSNGDNGTVSVSDTTGAISAYATRSCNGYGKMRVIKEGDSTRLLSFIPIKHIVSGPYRIVSTHFSVDGTLYKLDNGATVSLIENKGWGDVYETPNGYIR